MFRMKWVFLAILPILVSSLCAVENQEFNFQKLLERKYEAPIVFLETILAGPTTKVLWFDWQRNWWGSLNVVETNPDGTPLFWYDIRDFPTAQSLESVKMVDLSGHKFIEVIDCTHMGNGFLYLYEIDGGFVHLKLKARVIANLSLKFNPRLANIRYVDINADGQQDVVIDAEVVQVRDPDDEQPTGTTYHREFLFERGSFTELHTKRSGDKSLMD